MIIFGLTESSARFITGLITVLIVMAIFGGLSQATGVNPFILISIAALAFIAFIASLMRGSGSKRKTAPVYRRCKFIRANGSNCVNAKVGQSDFCEHHAAKAI